MRVAISELEGQTFTKVYADDAEFCLYNSLAKYRMFHEQQCCEDVYLDEVIGDINDLINTPIIEAREDTEYSNKEDDEYGSGEWTFYNFRTIKGSVTLRFYGTSNGHYSTSVDVHKFKI